MDGNLNATSAGGYTNANMGAVQSAVNNIGPFASTYQVPTYNTPQVLKNGGATGSSSALEQFFGKVDSVFKESGHMFESAAGWVARQGEDMVKGVADLAPSLYHFGMDTYHTWEYSSQQNELSSRLHDINTKYQSGQMSLAEYNSEMKQWQKDSVSLSGSTSALTTKIASDGNLVAKNDMAFISGVLTIVGGGLTGAAADVSKAGLQDMATFLTSKEAGGAFDPVVSAISRLAGDSKEFAGLPATIQNALKSSVTDTFMNVTGDMTRAQIARNTAVNLFLKAPLTFNYLNSTGNQIYADMANGKYGDAAKSVGFNALLMLSGGPIGYAMKFGGDALRGVSARIFGSTSFLDELSKTIGDGNPNGLYNTIKDNPDAIKAFQALEATNMASEDGKAISAAYRVVNGLKSNGWDLSTATHQEFVDNVMGWHQAQTTLHDELVKGGMNEAEANKYVVGRWTAADSNNVAAAVTKGDVAGIEQTSESRLKAWEDYKTANPNSAVANNENLDRQIKNILTTHTDPTEIDSAIRSIKAQYAAKLPGLPASAWKRIGRLGYVPIVPTKLEAPFVQGTQKLVTNAGETSEFFTKAVQPLPVLGELGGVLTHMGLSPNKAQESVQDIFRSNLADNIQRTTLVEGLGGKDAEDWADTTVKRLTDYVNNVNDVKYNLKHPPISDLRQMTRSEVSEALGVSSKQAAEVQSAMMDAMLQVPLSVRGLGDRMTDKAFQLSFIPRQYMRAQGAGRFAWNPFFKMRLASKTEILSQLESGGKWPSLVGMNKITDMVFPRMGERISATSDLMERQGFFSGGFTGEAADESGALRGMSAPKSSLLPSQKRSISGVVMSMSQRAGMSPHDFIDNYPNEVRDVTEMILHYNPKANFLNSPMARTLNFAFFPFRFNLKVATAMARTVGRQDAMTQMAVIHGVLQAHNFLTSQEGMQWYSQNSDAIKLLGYFAPLETLGTIAAFGNITHESIGSFGELGGLPAGFIPQILQAEGLWNPSGAYLDPKTGQPSPQYIPTTARAQLATAVASFIGSLFTYPGSEAGLPSKTKIDNGLAKGLTGTPSSEWNTVPPTQLTPQQQQYQQAVQSLQTSQKQTAPTPVQSGQNTTVPQTKPTTAQPYYKKTGSSTPPTTKLKKSQEPIGLLPGQSNIGQIL